jgi:NADH dehydrogenase
MLKPHVVILGAGFGGTYVGKRLAKYVKSGLIDVTIVNKTNYFLFTPLLHEVATGSLGPSSVAEPLREVFSGTGIELCQGTVHSIDLSTRKVHISSNNSRHTLPYDYLVIATGAETNFYGISGAEKYALPLKDLADAARIRTSLINCFEEAVMSEDETDRARLLSFVIVGGGPTGVETVAELNDFVHGIVDRYFPNKEECCHNDVKVILINFGDELLKQFSKPIRDIALDKLKAAGVDIRLNSEVMNVTSQSLTLADGSSIPSATIIWTAGVKPASHDFIGNQPLIESGRLLVDEFLRLVNSEKSPSAENFDKDERVFALGDISGYKEIKEANGSLDRSFSNVKPLPMLAQVTVQEAETVADNIIASIKQKKLKSFDYHPKGYLVSIGHWFAIGEIFSKVRQGKVVWWLWRTVYLFKFTSYKKRIRIAFEWTLQLFFPRDITKLT